jgi:hypothetical protein
MNNNTVYRYHIYNLYKDLNDEDKLNFKSNREIWYETLNMAENYILKNNKIPSKSDKNKEIKQLYV